MNRLKLAEAGFYHGFEFWKKNVEKNSASAAVGR